MRPSIWGLCFLSKGRHKRFYHPLTVWAEGCCKSCLCSCVVRCIHTALVNGQCTGESVSLERFGIVCIRDHGAILIWQGYSSEDLMLEEDTCKNSTFRVSFRSLVRHGGWEVFLATFRNMFGMRYLAEICEFSNFYSKYILCKTYMFPHPDPEIPLNVKSSMASSFKLV
jgi:hypothetical protein